MAKASRFIALVTGCAALAVSMLSCSDAPSDSQAGRETTIRRQEATWLEAIGNKQLDATVSYYGGGALLLVPNAPIARTKEEIRQTWMQVFTSIPPRGNRFRRDHEDRGGALRRLGLHHGNYAFGNPAIDKGKFVDVWKKQADGSWKAVIDIFNSDLPVPPTAK
ncbi:MAG: YybH family protein [Pseudonocardiaceae bacterium]